MLIYKKIKKHIRKNNKEHIKQKLKFLKLVFNKDFKNEIEEKKFDDDWTESILFAMQASKLTKRKGLPPHLS